MTGVRKLCATAIRMGEQARSMSAAMPATAPPETVEDSVAKAEQAAFKQAYLEGFDAGQADGLKDIQRQNDALREELEEATRDALAERTRWNEQTTLALKRLDTACEEYQASIEPMAVEIAYAAVCKIVGDMHAVQALVVAVCREILAGLRSEPVEVRVSEADFASMKEIAGSIQVVADRTLAPGDCVVRSRTGDVDGGISGQLTRLRQVLHAELGMRDLP